MQEMKELVWLFPVLFIIHEFEEIIGFGPWYKRKGKRLKERYPKVSRMLEGMFREYSTEGMAAAVLEEFLLCVGICIASLYYSRYELWIGVFAAFMLHMVMHAGQAIFFRGYVPSVITSVILLPICTVLLHKGIEISNIGMNKVMICALIGLLTIGLNVKVAHYLMHRVTKWIYSEDM